MTSQPRPVDQGIVNIPFTGSNHRREYAVCYNHTTVEHIVAQSCIMANIALPEWGMMVAVYRQARVRPNASAF